MTGLATKWASQFYAMLVDDGTATEELREGWLPSDFTQWTAALTAVVERSMELLGLVPTAKGFCCAFLPVERSEYVCQDVMAFVASGARWSSLVAVCELEKSAADNLVGYPLWKALCVRCGPRFVFCYQPEADSAAPPVALFGRAVVSPTPIGEWSAVPGDTLGVVSSCNEASTDPHSFFKCGSSARKPDDLNGSLESEQAMRTAWQ